jgi:hypothetical protein
MAVDSDACERRQWLSEWRLPASLVGNSGFNRVLEEESTMVLRVASYSIGGGWWWRLPMKRDGGQQWRGVGSESEARAIGRRSAKGFLCSATHGLYRWWKPEGGGNPVVTATAVPAV